MSYSDAIRRLSLATWGCVAALILFAVVVTLQVIGLSSGADLPSTLAGIGVLVALVAAVACAVPGILALRTVEVAALRQRAVDVEVGGEGVRVVVDRVSGRSTKLVVTVEIGSDTSPPDAVEVQRIAPDPSPSGRWRLPWWSASRD